LSLALGVPPRARGFDLRQGRHAGPRRRQRDPERAHRPLRRARLPAAHRGDRRQRPRRVDRPAREPWFRPRRHAALGGLQVRPLGGQRHHAAAAGPGRRYTASTTFPLTWRAAISFNASAAFSRGYIFETCGRSFPSRNHRPSWAMLSAKAFGSRRAKSPQNTPTTEAPLRSARFSGSLGISPEAQATTRAPSALPISIAARPTPPAAPSTSSVSPACSAPRSRNAWSEVP